MAISGTLTHAKTRQLARLLKIDLCYALGILESLWHLTNEQAPRGDIGRLTNKEIAEEMHYSGNSDRLIMGLLGSGFLEESGEYRLLVHDWKDHALQYVRRKLDRKGLVFCESDNGNKMTSHKLVNDYQNANTSAGTGTGTGIGKEGKESVRGKGTKQECMDYAIEIGLPGSDGESFFDVKEANGWKGKSGMVKDWKAAMRYWKSQSFHPSQKGVQQAKAIRSIDDIFGGTNARRT